MDPGQYLYTDAMPGAEPLPVQVLRDGDELIARFPPADGDDIPVADMSGTFQPA